MSTDNLINQLQTVRDNTQQMITELDKRVKVAYFLLGLCVGLVIGAALTAVIFLTLV